MDTAMHDNDCPPPRAPLPFLFSRTLHLLEMKEARADRGAINITLNSFGGPLNEPVMRTTDRRRLYPAIGALYPEATNSFQVRGHTVYGIRYMVHGTRPLRQHGCFLRS